MTSPSVLSNRPAVLDTRAILDAVDAVLADAVRPVELHEPRFGARERELVLDCIDTGWVSTAGKYVGQFEQMVASATGVRHAIAIVNGTAALHAALLAEGVKPNDEVILPSITFVATANAVSHTGAVPHFVDFDLGYARARSRRAGAASSGDCDVARRRDRQPRDRARDPRHRAGAYFRPSGRHGAAAGGRRQIRSCRGGGCHRIAGLDLAGENLRFVRPFRGALLQRQQDHHHRRRRHDPDRRRRLRAARAAFHHHREEVARLVVRPRRDRLQLPAAQHQRGAGLRPDGEAAGVSWRPSAGLPSAISTSSRASRARASSASPRARTATTGSTRWCSTANLPAIATACSANCMPMASAPARCGPRCTCFRCTAIARARRSHVAEDMYARCINLPSSPFLAASAIER